MLLVIAGDVEIDPAKREEGFAAARKVMAATRAEPGCLEYTIAADLDDPARFVIFEKWASPEALESHFETPHMAEFQAAMAGLGVRRLDVERYEVARQGPVRG
jgi:quinol monooxygenase YgiN